MRNCAILLGIPLYEKATGLETLHGISNSVNLMKSALINSCCCNKEDVFILSTQTLGEGGKQNKSISGQAILRNIETISEAIARRENTMMVYDNIYFYYIGHGVTDHNGNPCILPSDSVIVNQADGFLFGELQITTIINMIRACFRNKYRHVILFLDTCRSVLSEDKNAYIFQPDLLPQDTIVFFSSFPYHQSFSDRSKGGIFTMALAEALQSELRAQSADQINKSVRRIMHSRYKTQVPIMQFSGDEQKNIVVSVGGYSVFPPPTAEEKNSITIRRTSTSVYGHDCFIEYNTLKMQIVVAKERANNVLFSFYSDKNIRKASRYLKLPTFFLRRVIRRRLSKVIVGLTLEIDEMLKNQQEATTILLQSQENAAKLLRKCGVYVHVGIHEIKKREQATGPDFDKQLIKLHDIAVDLENFLKSLSDYNSHLQVFSDNMKELHEVLHTLTSTPIALYGSQVNTSTLKNTLLLIKSESKHFYLDQLQL